MGGLGFRKLRNLNTALLTKMVTHILNEPDSLWVRILKGPYFPNSDFLLVTKGGRASWGWVNMLHSRDTLQQDGCGWQIGDGATIHVYKNPWIFTKLGFRVEGTLTRDDTPEIRVNTHRPRSIM